MIKGSLLDIYTQAEAPPLESRPSAKKLVEELFQALGNIQSDQGVCVFWRYRRTWGMQTTTKDYCINVEGQQGKIWALLDKDYNLTITDPTNTLQNLKQNPQIAQKFTSIKDNPIATLALITAYANPNQATLILQEAQPIADKYIPAPKSSPEIGVGTSPQGMA